MSDFLGRIFNQIGSFFGELTPARRIAMILTGVGILGALSAIFVWAGNQSYSPLMTNLSPEDSTNIIRILREKRIPFRVDPTGKNVEVPPESIYDLRLELATMGLPESSTVGYEIFDQQALGQTSFVQRVNKKRALEGELIRTIQNFQAVRRARVHLAIPEDSTFIEDQKKPSASVVLDLHQGAKLTEKQISGIGTMVASAIEGLEMSDVVIVDSSGKVLSKNASDPYIHLSATQADFKNQVERNMESRVEGLLSRVVGEGRVVVKVNADLDFSRVSETQTLVDPDSVAKLSEENYDESAVMNRPVAQGAPGAATNTPGEQPGVGNNGAAVTNTQKNRGVANYEVPKTVRQTVKPYGSVQKLSVSVLIDGKLVQEKQEDGTILAKTEAWSPEKIEEFRQIVAKAVGLDAKRGDQLEIANMEFTREDFRAAEELIAANERRSYIRNMIVYSVIGMVILLFFLFVVRPYIKWITENTTDSVDSFLPQTIEELENLQRGNQLPGLEDTVPVIPEKIDPDKVEGEMIKEKIITLVDTNPHKAAMIVRDWLKVEAPAKGGQTA